MQKRSGLDCSAPALSLCFLWQSSFWSPHNRLSCRCRFCNRTTAPDENIKFLYFSLVFSVIGRSFRADATAHPTIVWPKAEVPLSACRGSLRSCVTGTAGRLVGRKGHGNMSFSFRSQAARLRKMEATWKGQTLTSFLGTTVNEKGKAFNIILAPRQKNIIFSPPPPWQNGNHLCI